VTQLYGNKEGRLESLLVPGTSNQTATLRRPQNKRMRCKNNDIMSHILAGEQIGILER